MTTDQPATVLLPVQPGLPVRTLMDLAESMARVPTGRAIVLSVVEVPEERSLSEGVSVARRRREILRRLGEDESQQNVDFAVRAARTIQEGIREAVTETQATMLLLGWRGAMRSEERLRRTALDSLILSPPCDLTIYRAPRTGSGAQHQWPPRSILVPVRGGLHADLAMETAARIAEHFEARITIMRIQRDDVTQTGTRFDNAAAIGPRSRVVDVAAESVEDAIADEASRHDLLIMGASARGPRSTHLFGQLPERLADRVSSGVMIVRTAAPLRAEMFGEVTADLHSVSTDRQSSISRVVDQWFAENTFHSHEFEDIQRLIRLKERQGVTISLALPALDEDATVGRIISTIKQRFMEECPLIDEMILVDSGSTDRTREIANDLGIPVFIHGDILPKYGSHIGKGEALWKSLQVTRGDILVWVDSDVTDFHPKFVYGLIGPLLTEPRIDFVKGYYRRPLRLGSDMLTTGGGRVTELTARPLINLFYPQLSGLVQPLAGEMAGRRRLLEGLPFFTGYGVETGLLIDILERHGLSHIGQTDLENRIHRNQDMISLSKMAFAIVQVVMKRLEERQHITLLEEINTTMKLIHYSPEELFLEVKEIREYERPPIRSLAEYAERTAGGPAERLLEPEPAT